MTNQEVNHKEFGKGIIVGEDAKAQTVVVNFNGTSKTMLIKYANLLLEDGSIYKLAKPRKVYEKLTPLTEKEKSELLERTIESLIDANKDCKSSGLKGFGYIHH